MDTLKQFSPAERASLYTIVSHEGFNVLNEIIKIEVGKFGDDLLNADPAKQDEVLAKHYLAKAAAMVYTAVANRINMECDLYLKTPKMTDVPIDITEGVLNIDDIPYDEIREEHSNELRGY